ncbi:MAG: hypothetical protein AAF587_13145 [Bacteroidota bacterium]
MSIVFRAFQFCLLIFLISPLPAQPSSLSPSPPDERIRVYLDCSFCDMTYLRQELTWFDHVRDPQIADVHILVTRQSTGANSQTYQMDFIGKESFSSIAQSLSMHTLPNSARDLVRKEVAKTITLGMVPYVAQTDMASNIEVQVASKETKNTRTLEHDPWNNWVFRVHANGNFSQETTKRNFRFRGGAEANRITEDWRMRNSVYMSYNERYFLNEGEKIISNTRYQSFNTSYIYSLSGHWSAGLFGKAYSSTYSNIDASLRMGPALEFSVFPYSDVHRREITLAYHVGYKYRWYLAETIFGKMQEGLLEESLRMAVRFRQPWGSIYASANASHYFHDFSRNRMELDGNLSFRIVKGLSVQVSGDMEIIHDQLALAAGETSLEELLLQQTQLATGYKVGGSVGLSYTFGSIYNNVVNTRL